MRQRIFSDRFTWIALAAMILLVGASLLTQSNADFYSGDNFYDRQVIWVLFGLVGFVLATLVDMRIVERVSYVFWGLCVVLLIVTALVGTEVNNSKRWLRFGSFNLQASEMTKLGIVLALSRYFHAQKERIPGEEVKHTGVYTLRKLIKPMLFVVIPVAFIIRQPDLGTSLLILFVAGSVALYEGVSRRGLIAVGLTVAIVVPVAWKSEMIRDYQKDRVRLWIDADWGKVDPDAAMVAKAQNLQGEQAIWSIGSGQFWGQGSRSGTQSRLKYLPEMHTDMIVATFAEEQGFLGCTLLLLLFWFVVVWGLRTAQDGRDRYCRLIAVGVASMIGWQVFINIGMVAGLLPIVGLPLPFLSYGGSAMLTTMISLGLVLNCALRRGRL